MEAKMFGINQRRMPEASFVFGRVHASCSVYQGVKMAKFRKKPVIVEAVRFDPCGAHRVVLPVGVDGVPSPGSDNWAITPAVASS